jgi:hypothetical protein
MWLDEKVGGSKQNPFFSMCCAKGKRSVVPIKPLPSFLDSLLKRSDVESRNFKKYIRLYNSIFTFTSMRANVDEKLANMNNGLYTYRIHDSVYHSSGPIQPDRKEEAKFAQIYIYEQSSPIDRRCSLFDCLDRNIIIQLQTFLSTNNKFVKIFYSVGERFLVEPSLDLIIIIRSSYYIACDKHRYNKPYDNEVAILLGGSAGT